MTKNKQTKGYWTANISFYYRAKVSRLRAVPFFPYCPLRMERKNRKVFKIFKETSKIVVVWKGPLIPLVCSLHFIILPPVCSLNFTPAGNATHFKAFSFQLRRVRNVDNLVTKMRIRKMILIKHVAPNISKKFTKMCHFCVRRAI